MPTPSFTLPQRIANIVGNERMAEACIAAFMVDIKLMYTIMDKNTTLLGTYPVKPGAQEIYDATDLARKQYRPIFVK